MLSIIRKVLFIAIVSAMPLLTYAVDKIEVLGLSKGKALVNIDGKQHMLLVGQLSPEGVRLIKATANEAELEVQGKRDIYRLGQQISANFTPAAETITRITRNRYGMYTTDGTVNGRTVNFLVDTGATVIAMNSLEAKRLGIDYKRGKPMNMNTAGGIAPAFGVHLSSVKVGAIELRNIDAVVMEGTAPEMLLLGMSFLGRLNIQHEGQLLVLKLQR